ncbi:MAG: pilus assembly protein PilM [Acetatifactor sp.]|nr:pilus assembly protein PilM [Acetatifactor sp.]
MARILSIELGHSVIKLCEMDHKVKRPKVYQCLEAITPAGAVTDGYIAENKMKDLAYAIKETIARNGIKTKRVIFTVASAKIINREVTVPGVKEAQIPSVVQANLSEYFPVSLAEYEVTQSLTQTLTDGPDQGKHKVLVFAAEKSMLNSYRKLADACDLDIVNVCCSGASIIEAARTQRASGCQAIIKMEEKYSIISVVKDGVLMLQRSINYGVGDAMNVVATQPSFAAGDTLAVWRLITRQNCTAEPVSNMKDAGRPEARVAVSEALNPMLNGVMRVFDYFNSHFDGAEIENVSIIGLGAQFVGVPEILGEALGIVCRKAGMSYDVEVFDTDVKQKSDAFFSCIGAGFAVDGFLHDDPKVKVSKEPNYTVASILVGILGVVVAVVMVVMSILPYKEQQAREKELTDLKVKYEEGKKAYDAMLGTKSLYEEILKGTSMSKHANDNLLLFLAELEEKLPYNVVLKEFSSDDEQCIMQMIVDDKGTAAKIVNTLRSFESVMNVVVESVNEEEIKKEDQNRNEDELGVEAVETRVVFTVNCIYYPVEIDNSVVENTAAGAGDSAAQN